MDKVVHFEIPYEKKDRAKDFYAKTFDWNFKDVQEMDYILAYTSKIGPDGKQAEVGAINGGMIKKDAMAPYPIITTSVEDIGKTLKKVESNGGKIVMPAVNVGDFAKYARVKDSEGNIVGIWQDVKKQ